ncbi:MAG: PH domain-containing protein [Kineosporiaceae bacterium]|nr:PH domain-containing protein [Kineosporiaceae bacterium]MBK7624170.1 PH domain-containing protein [Kineosporiaceae bacterium]
MFALPQPWPWTVRKGRELPSEFQRYLSDPELNGEALGGQAHWTVMIQPILTTAGGLFLCFLLLTQLSGDRLAGLGFLVTLAVLLLVGRLAFHYWEWTRNLVFITGKRVITVTGIFTRNVAMLPLGKLTDMNYIRGPIGYLLGFGQFRMETAGQNQAVEMLRHIPNPDASYRHVQNLLFGRGTTDVILLDVKTDKPVTVRQERPFKVRFRGRTRPKGAGVEFETDDDPDDWYSGPTSAAPPPAAPPPPGPSRTPGPRRPAPPGRARGTGTPGPRPASPPGTPGGSAAGSAPPRSRPIPPQPPHPSGGPTPGSAAAPGPAPRGKSWSLDEAWDDEAD